MTPIFRNNLGAAGYIIILQIVIIAFFGLMFIGTQLQSIDIKQIALQSQETANDTNEIIQSGNRTGQIISEIQRFGNESAEDRERLLDTLVPELQQSFNQTDKIEERLTNLSSLQSSAKEDRMTMINQLDSIMSLLNETN